MADRDGFYLRMNSVTVTEPIEDWMVYLAETENCIPRFGASALSSPVDQIYRTHLQNVRNQSKPGSILRLPDPIDTIGNNHPETGGIIENQGESTLILQTPDLINPLEDDQPEARISEYEVEHGLILQGLGIAQDEVEPVFIFQAPKPIMINLTGNNQYAAGNSEIQTEPALIFQAAPDSINPAENNYQIDENMAVVAAAPIDGGQRQTQATTEPVEVQHKPGDSQGRDEPMAAVGYEGQDETITGVEEGRDEPLFGGVQGPQQVVLGESEGKDQPMPRGRDKGKKQPILASKRGRGRPGQRHIQIEEQAEKDQQKRVKNEENDDDRPDWLPIDWEEVTKSRLTGENEGDDADKYYMSLHGRLFRSRKHAQTYLIDTGAIRLPSTISRSSSCHEK